MYCIVNVVVSNETESTISVDELAFSQVAIAEKYAEQIVDISGKTVKDDTAVNGTLIAGDYAIAKPSPTATSMYDSIVLEIDNRNALNTLRVAVRSSSTISITAGSSLYVSGRIPLTLL